MRINKFLALATGLGRRQADVAVMSGRVLVNGDSATPGQQITANDRVYLDGRLLNSASVIAVPQLVTIMLNKPAGYVVSRKGQGNQTIYTLLPSSYRHLKPVGRLDKNSSGLLLLTNDGQLAQQLTHPSHQKQKVYEVRLHQPLQPLHRSVINDRGVELEDGLSRLKLEPRDATGRAWRITMHEGRNRQIRRTFAALGYKVSKLHRIQFDTYRLDNLAEGHVKVLS